VLNSEQIVVVGFGWVGQANALALASIGYQVSYFDPQDVPAHYSSYSDVYLRIQRLKDVRERDSGNTVYVVCVGDRVDEKGVQNISFIESALNSLRGVKGTVVLRSTVLPDVVENLFFDYYVPEFLHEKAAVEECLVPYFVVTGMADTQKREPSFLPMWRTHTPRQIVCTPREAAFIKYLSNLWNATRVAFVNEFGNTIATPESPEAVENIHKIVDFVLGGEMYQRYGRSFGGHCLPKDTSAFAHWYSREGRNTALLQGVLDSNATQDQFEKQYPDIPEWFSFWPTPHLSGFVALRELLYSIQKNLRDPSEFVARYRRKVVWFSIVVLLIIIVLIAVL